MIDILQTKIFKNELELLFEEKELEEKLTTEVLHEKAFDSLNQYINQEFLAFFVKSKTNRLKSNYI